MHVTRAHDNDLFRNGAGGYESDISTQLLRVSCAICGRPLRDPTSLERGWGPVCDEKRMGGSGGAHVWAAMENFDPETFASAVREAPTVVPTRWIEPVANASGKLTIVKLFKKGENLPDGTKALGGEVQTPGRPLRPGSMREYLENKGGSPDDPHAAWRSGSEVRRLMVSGAIWYASRAVTFGFDGDVVSAEKVDPKWLVVAAAQRLARAAGLDAVAEAMTEFYASSVTRIFSAHMKRAKKNEGKKGFVFESVPSDHVMEVYDPNAGRKVRQAVGPGTIRVHVPYSQEFNDLARKNSHIFFAYEGEKNFWPYKYQNYAMFWRYFNVRHLREVNNIIQGIWDDVVVTSRTMTTVERRLAYVKHTEGKDAVIDTATNVVKYVTHSVASKLVEMGPSQTGKTMVEVGRYRYVKKAK